MNTTQVTFVVNIKFNDINPKTLLLRNVSSYVRKKKMEPYERSNLQLLSIAVREQEKDKLNSFLCNSKTHSTIKEEKYIPLYVKDLHFLITRAGWLVTHIYDHYTFEQSKFKKDFVIMKQMARQTATSSVEKDFYKLLNNDNFGIDCRNNIDNWSLSMMIFQKSLT